MQVLVRRSESNVAQETEWMEFARQTLLVEAEAIRGAAERLTPEFIHALDLLDNCAGKVITTGVGKSGIAARKLAATLTSTGCPAVFLHPSEAMHGDLGIVESDDVIVALSNGGESEELLAMLPALLARDVPILSIVGNSRSTLAQKSTCILDASIEREACPLNLAPTTSVVVAMALGDALAMTLQKRRGFLAEDYARNHPGGRLGRRLTLRVQDVMLQGDANLPVVRPDATLMEVLSEISAKCMGATCVVDSGNVLCGIITDYDVRKAFQREGSNSFSLSAQEVMNPNPVVLLAPEQMAFHALQQMEDRPRVISVAPVVNSERHCIGMLRIHDLVRAGL